MSILGRLRCTAWLAIFAATQITAAEPTKHWSDPTPGSTFNANDLYDGQTPSNLDTCNSSVWQTRSPKVQFTFDLLVMDRASGGSSPLLIDSVTGQVLLSTGDIIEDAEPGVRLGLIFLEEGGTDVEFNYLGLDTFEGVKTTSSSNPITFPFFGGIPGNPRRSYTVEYASEINSGVFNLRHALGPQVSWIAGLRFIELREKFDIYSSQGGFFSHTDNDLYGFQLGGDVQLFRICESLVFSTMKAGVYYNRADVTATAATNSGAISLMADEDVAAFTGDLTVGMLIPRGPSADLRLGYQGLFLDGVGLAPDQSANYSLFTSSGSLDQSSVFYHGGFLGVDFFW